MKRKRAYIGGDVPLARIMSGSLSQRYNPATRWRPYGERVKNQTEAVSSTKPSQPRAAA